jgi:hypothetical protein
MRNILSGRRTVRQRQCDAVARQGTSLQRRGHAATTKSNFGDLGWSEIRERFSTAFTN